MLLVCVLSTGCPDDTTMPWRPPPKQTLDAAVSAVGQKIDPVGLLKLTRGVVTLTRNQNRASALPGPLLVGDVVETDANSEATLVFGSRREVILGANGRYEVRSEDTGLVLSIERGELRTRPTAPGAAGEDFELTIDTPRAVTRLGSNDAVNIDIRGNNVDFEVVSGRIAYLTKEGESVTIEAGTRKRISSNAVATAPTKPLSLAILSTNGRLQYRGNGKSAFVNVNAKNPPPLVDGDALKSDGEARLGTAETAGNFTLERGSEVVVGVSALGDGREDHVLRLSRGQLSVRAESGKRTTIQLSSDLSVDIVNGGQATLAKTKTGYAINSLTGALQINLAGKPAVAVPGGYNAILVGDAVEVQPPQRESLTLPTRNGLRLYHAGIPRVSLSWTSDGKDAAESSTGYRVQVATEPTFAAPTLSGLVQQRFVTVSVPRRGPLFWRVYDGESGPELVRGNLLSGPEPLGKDLSRLQNDVLAGNEKTTIYFQDKPPLVNFLFTEEPGAAKYQLKVFREGELSRSMAERLVDSLSVSLPEGTLSEGKYLWSVTPLDVKGQELRGGRLNKLEMVYDNAVSNLIIRTPKNGDAGGRKTKVNGIAPPGARVTANGKALDLDEKGRFDDSVEATAGRVVFRMVNGSSEVYTVRSVRGGP